MPTVLLTGARRVVIYPNDHRPAHVHVIGAGEEAVFRLHCPSGPVEPWENFGVSRADVRRIKTALRAAQMHLCAEWRRIHGEP